MLDEDRCYSRTGQYSREREVMTWVNWVNWVNWAVVVGGSFVDYYCYYSTRAVEGLESQGEQEMRRALI